MIYRGSDGLYAAAGPWVTRLGSRSTLACVSGRIGYVFRNRRCSIGVLEIHRQSSYNSVRSLAAGTDLQGPLDATTRERIGRSA